MGQEIMILGKRIEKIIKQKVLKIREVAHDADVDVENLLKYFKEKQEMQISTMIKIVRALYIKVADLFEDVDVKP